MPEDPAPLAVWCFARQAGALTQSANGTEFAYAAEWVADEMAPLSQSLPLDGRFDAAAAAAFFGGLLPEGEPRRHLARLLGVWFMSRFRGVGYLRICRAFMKLRSVARGQICLFWYPFGTRLRGRVARLLGACRRSGEIP
jgi:HipA-like protein